MNYWRKVYEFSRCHVPDNPMWGGYDGHDDRPQWLRRWHIIKNIDGPIRTVFLWNLKARYNWFTIGFSCWRKGHEWREQFITNAPERKLGPVEPGVVRFVQTGHTARHTIKACARCGKYMGHSWDRVT